MDQRINHHSDDQLNTTKKASLFASLFSAIFYGVCSTSMAFINKAVISSYAFNFPFFIMTCQMAVSIAVLELCSVLHFIPLPKFTIVRATSLFWSSVFFATHSITSLYALSGMSIPMYAAVKRCSPIVTLVLSVILLRKPFPNISITLSVFLITVGCVLAGLGDLEFDMAAYSYGAVSVLVQGTYLTLVQKGAESLSALEILHVNSYNSLPVFIILSLLFDVSGIMSYHGLTGFGFLVCFMLQVSIGVLLNFSLFMCTADNSALTTSLIGVMKSMIQTLVGSFTFGGIIFNELNIFGITLNTIGGIIYVFVKYKEKQNAHASTFSLSTTDKLV